MLPTDARTLRVAVAPTAAAGAITGVVAGFVAGSSAVLGAIAGTLLVVGFFSTSVVVVGWVAQRDTFATLPVAMFVYMFKITILAIVLAVFRDTTLFDPTAFGVGILVATLCWLGAATWALATAKILYVDPREADRPL